MSKIPLAKHIDLRLEVGMIRILPITLTILLILAFRVLGGMYPEQIPNFQPVAALFFTGCLLAKGWRGYAIPFALWFMTYPLTSTLQGYSAWTGIGSVLLFLSISFFIGKACLHMRFRAFSWIISSILVALLFHSLTSLSAWLTDPRYLKTALGFQQSFWSGLPTDALPSWVFLRNSLVANALFTTILFISRRSWGITSDRAISRPANS